MPGGIRVRVIARRAGEKTMNDEVRRAVHQKQPLVPGVGVPYPLEPVKDVTYPLFVVADRLEGRTEEFAEGTGEVELRRAGSLFFGDKMTYWPLDDEVEVTGSARMLQEGQEINTPHFRLQLSEQVGFAEKPDFYIVREVTSKFYRPQVPVVTAVNGFCVGGAFMQLVACDFAIAAERSAISASATSAPGTSATATPTAARTAIDTDGTTSVQVATSRLRDVLRYSNRNTTRPGRATTALDDARARGAQVLPLLGGQAFDAATRKIAPHIVLNAPADCELRTREIFGPVLVVIGFDDEDDAVRIANDSRYGLAGNVMAGSVEHALAVASRLRAGFIGINGTAGYGADTPFGGYKASGVGRQNGTAGFDQYTEIKSVAYPAN